MKVLHTIIAYSVLTWSVRSQLTAVDPNDSLEKDTVPNPTPHPVQPPLIAVDDNSLDSDSFNYGDGTRCLDLSEWKKLSAALRETIISCDLCKNAAKLWTSLDGGLDVGPIDTKACGTEPANVAIPWLADGVVCWEREAPVIWYSTPFLDNDTPCKYCSNGYEYHSDHKWKCGPSPCWAYNTSCKKDIAPSGKLCYHCCSGKSYKFMGFWGRYCKK